MRGVCWLVRCLCVVGRVASDVVSVVTMALLRNITTTIVRIVIALVCVCVPTGDGVACPL